MFEVELLAILASSADVPLEESGCPLGTTEKWNAVLGMYSHRILQTEQNSQYL
jgi:hypothetical protein